MAERQPGNNWKIKGLTVVQHHVVDGMGIAAILEIAENQTTQMGEYPGKLEMVQRPIQAIERFAAVFNEQQGTVCCWKIFCSNRMRHAGKIASQNLAGCYPVAKNMLRFQRPAKICFTLERFQYAVELSRKRICIE